MKKVLFLFLLAPFFIYSGTTGKLSGTIKDAQTGDPLVGANVIIEGTNFGAATNIEGEYVILNIHLADIMLNSVSLVTKLLLCRMYL